MAELPEGFYAVGVDATAEQERGGTVVAVQEVPVELVAGTAVLRGLGVEEVVVAQTIVGRYGKQVLGQQDRESLDEVQACIAQGTAVFGKDYFRELLERVRSIRASERRIWQQITDIYAECSIDYDKSSPTTQDFYAMIQNRFHYAITGQTAAEIIYTKADHTQEHMGLTTWKNAPDGRILKSDVSIAKNYLQENEIRRLERAVTGYFDYIEDLIERENTFNMEQFAASVNEFLTFRKYQILPDKGRISAAQAKAKAESEYDIFNKTQRIDSDFDKQIKGMLDK